MKRSAIAIAALLGVTLPVLPAHAADEQHAAAAPVITAPARISRPASRPRALTPLYVSYTTLQAFDVYSTKQALARDAREANPLMQGVVRNNDAFVAIKAAVVVNTIFAAERLWRTNKGAAIAVMIASNGVAALLAARNARTLRRLGN